MKILLVEDHPDDALIMRRQLANESCEDTESMTLVHVDSLAEARTSLEKETFDIVLLDLGLGETQGIMTLERFQETAWRVPVVVLTGLDDMAVAVRAVQLGAQDYLVKDKITGQVLLHTMRHSLERHRLQVELDEARMSARDERDRREELRRYFLATQIDLPPDPADENISDFGDLDQEYEDLIMAHLKNAGTDEDRHRHARMIANSMAKSKARAKDVVKIHVQIMESILTDASPVSSRIMAGFARVVLIEVLSLLLDHYCDETKTPSDSASDASLSI